MTRRHVLFVTYNGLLEPLGLRQGLAYLEPLTDEFAFTVLSYEKVTEAEDPTGWSNIQERLRNHGIDWIPLPYHRRPSVPATLFDVWAGARAGASLHRRKPLALVHARGYVPCAIALRCSLATGAPFIFDIRGLLADEYVDGGVWSEGSLPWRLTRWAETRFLRRAAGIVTLTEAIRGEVEGRMAAAGRPGAPPPWQVIPCCVDSDAFRPDAGARSQTRTELGFGNEPVVVYSGSIGTWYPVAPMIQFFAEVRRHRPDARLLLLMNGSDAPLREGLTSQGIPDDAVRTVSARPDDVPRYLNSADFGMSLIQPSRSKRASSPTKVAEYLACGLGVVVNSGVGDLHELEGEPGVVVAASLDAPSISAAARQAVDCFPLDPSGPRGVAVARFDLRTVGAERYRSLYRAVAPAPFAPPDSNR